MRQFALLARDVEGRIIAQHCFDAESDRDALAVGALKVMKLAYPMVQPWCDAHIDLVNDLNVVLAEMGEKPERHA